MDRETTDLTNGVIERLAKIGQQLEAERLLLQTRPSPAVRDVAKRIKKIEDELELTVTQLEAWVENQKL